MYAKPSIILSSFTGSGGGGGGGGSFGGHRRYGGRRLPAFRQPVGRVSNSDGRGRDDRDGRYAQHLIITVTAVPGIGQQVVNATPAGITGAAVVVVVTEQQVLRTRSPLLYALPPRSVRSATSGRRRFVRRWRDGVIVAVRPQET